MDGAGGEREASGALHADGRELAGEGEGIGRGEAGEDTGGELSG